MPWGAAIGAAGAVAGGLLSSSSSSKAARAQQRAAEAAAAEQKRQFDLTRQDQLPFLQAGQNAVGLQQRFLAGDTSGFENSPDYRFAVQQGTRQLDAGAASRGNIWGGGTDADRIQLGQGLATQYANNYWNKLAGQANQGQVSANTLGSLGSNMANNIGNYNVNAGEGRASSYLAQGNNWNNTLNQLGNIGAQYFGGGFGSRNTTPSGSGYGLGNNQGNYWSQYGQPGSGNFNFAAMSGGG